MADTSFIITREDLYRRVWEVPFKQLVEELGTTYADLRRIAETMGVPRPASGYWKKHAAGIAGERPPLPEPTAGQPVSMKVERVDLARKASRDQWQAMERLLGDLRVPEKLIRPHPLVASWIAARRRQERHLPRQNTASTSLYQPNGADGRRHRILQALLPALERQGAKIVGEYDEGVIEARFVGTTIAFRLREKLKQVRRPLSEDELRHGWGTEKNYHIELHPTGLLSCKIETYTRIGWRAWEDDRGGALEGRLVEIAGTILMARDSQIDAAREARIQHEQQMERERQQAAAAEARQREENRWGTFVELARRSEEAEQLRAFLKRLESMAPPGEQLFGDRTVADWLSWAYERLHRNDPLANGSGEVFVKLARGTL
ncbi:hypothetical protein MKK50_17965 [Methylobacterium sp. J-043]|nr:hypothetical protein [Methylobacterium sp. J-043]